FRVYFCAFQLLFFYCLHDYLYLHSFPTRRSSDLRCTRPEPRRDCFVAGQRSANGAADRRTLHPADDGPLHRATSGSLLPDFRGRDRKSTRLNSSHRTISYAVFCLKKKKNITPNEL